jgi:chromosome segregation ATPase
MSRRGGKGPTLPDQLKEKTAEVKRLQSDLETANKALVQANKETDSQKSITSNQIAQNEGLKKNLATKDGELAAMNQTLIKQKAETDIDKLEIKRLQDLNQTTQEQLEKLNTQVDSVKQLQKDKDELLAKILTLEFEKDDQQTELEAFKQVGNNDQVKKQTDEIQKKIEERNAELQGNVDGAKAKVEEHLQIIKVNEEMIQELKQNIQQNEIDKERKILEMNQNVEQLQKTITGLEAEKNKLSMDWIQTNGNQEREIQELQASIQTANEKITTQIDNIKDLMASIVSHEKTRDDHVVTIQRNNEVITEKEKAIKDLNETIKGLQETNKQVEDGRKHYQTEYQTKNTELHNMTQMNIKLQAQIAAGNPAAELTVVQDQVNELTRDLDKRILDKDRQIIELNTEIDKLKTQLASQSSSDDHRKDTKNTKPRKTQSELLSHA